MNLNTESMSVEVSTCPAAGQDTAPDSPPTTKRAENSIQVSLDRQPRFYARLARRMMLGDAENNAHDVGYDTVVLSGLGMAMKVAIGAASLLENEEAGVIRKVETCVLESSKNRRRVPKISILVEKGPNLAPSATGSDEEGGSREDTGSAEAHNSD